MPSERFMQQHYGASGYKDKEQYRVDLIAMVRELLKEYGRTDLDTFADIKLICDIHSALNGETLEWNGKTARMQRGGTFGS